MSDITPALTREEWRLVQLWAAGKMIGGKVRGMVVRGLPDEHRHGAAACALYGQTFGFTRDDVDDLRWIATEYLVPGTSTARRVEQLADRIAALLPPEAG